MLKIRCMRSACTKPLMMTVSYSLRRRNQYGRKRRRSMSFGEPNRPMRLIAMVATNRTSAAETCEPTMPPKPDPMTGPGALCRNCSSEVWPAAGLTVAVDRVDAALQVGCVDDAVAHGRRRREAPLRFLLHRFLARRIEIHPADRTGGAIDRNDRSRARAGILACSDSCRDNQLLADRSARPRPARHRSLPSQLAVPCIDCEYADAVGRARVDDAVAHDRRRFDP